MDVITVDIFDTQRVDAGLGGAKLVQGPRGEPGAVYVPAVTDGVLSWTNDAGLENPAPVDITGPQGERGASGAKGDKGDRGDAGYVFTPSVSAEGVISWTNDGGLPNPEPVSVRGAQGSPGDDGGYYVPGVDGDGNLSWTASRAGMPGVAAANIRGPKGDPGTGLDILGQYESLAALQAAVAQPEIGDNYYVGTAAPYSIYTWTDVGGVPQWLDGGQLQGAPGADGGYYTPSVDGAGNLTWAASRSGMPGVAGANIRGAKGDTGDAGAPGSPGADGGYYTPSIDGDGNLTWTASKGGMEPAAGANIKGDPGSDGAPGADGGYYTPSVDASGNLTWTASRSGMPGVTASNIRGPKGDDGQDGATGASATINGVNALTLAAGENVEIEQSGSTVTISASGGAAMFVNVTGSDNSWSADKTNAEIYAAFQAGKPIYALWQGMMLMPFQVEPEVAWFVYTASLDYGNVVVQTDSGVQRVFCDYAAASAGSIAYTDTYSVLDADTVQEAIDAILVMFGAV